MKDVIGYTAMVYGTRDRRYEAGARALHWITALLVFAVVPLGWMFAEFKTKGDPPIAFAGPWPGTPFGYSSVHKTIGLTIFVLVLARVVYRFVHRPPPLPRRMPAWQKGVAHASHWLLYLTLLGMPISGYIMTSASKHSISILGLFDVPKLPVDKAVGDIAMKAHLTAQFVLYALVIGHIAAVVWHIAVTRDGLLDRMLPRQANAE